MSSVFYLLFLQFGVFVGFLHLTVYLALELDNLHTVHMKIQSITRVNYTPILPSTFELKPPFHLYRKPHRKSTNINAKKYTS